MSFNKTKAMRNAERYLTQGKIQAAINEYRQVVDNDSKDMNSRNMLGDLYVKANDNQSAVRCYEEIAEHYNSQGFAKKAIAIYKKIYRIEPDSMEVASKLAELYQERGSIAEAQKHYETLAKRYEENGHRIEALAIWEKIAQISPRDKDIYVKIANAYWQDDRKEEAAKAFVEAGKRLFEAEKYQEAATSFSHSLEVNAEDFKALKGFVKSQMKLGYPEEAATALEKVLENDPYNKEVNYLLTDCYFEMGNPQKAEELILKLVEREPANYAKLLDLAEVYLEDEELDSAVRILSMTSEHLLVGGESETLLDFINKVLAIDSEHIEALRLLARYHGWQRDEHELQKTLERLAESARLNESVEDERYALSQYLLLVPHDVERSERLKEINDENGFEDGEVEEKLLSSDSEEQLINDDSNEVPTFESYAVLSDDGDTSSENGFEMVSPSDVSIAEDQNWEEQNNSQTEEVEAEIVSENSQVAESFEEDAVVEENQPELSQETENSEEVENSVDAELSPSDEVRVDEEIGSISFYIEQGYKDLADKSLSELENEFGHRKEFVELREKLGIPSKDSNEPIEEVVETETADVTEAAETDQVEVDVEEVETIENQSEESQDEFSGEDKVEVENYENEETVTAEFVEEDSQPQEVVEEDFEPQVETEDETLEEPQEEASEIEKETAEIEESVEELSEESEEEAEEAEPAQETVSESVQEVEDEPVQESVEEVEETEERDYSNSFDDFKNELGLDEAQEETEQNDYEEHYQHAVVYQEMGMLEEAIREFQDAVDCISPDDGTQRFLNCCTLIGHCFMQKEMPKLALSWFEKALETPDLDDKEKIGIYYEIGSAYEANGEHDKAIEQFEMIYSRDVDFRDVGERLETLRENSLTTA